jgi:hypothetical protein
MSSPDHVLIVFGIVLPCITLIGVWSFADLIRLARLIRSGRA